MLLFRHLLFIALIIAPDKTYFFSVKVLIFSYFLTKTYVVGTNEKCLTKALFMSTHNVYFHQEIRKIQCGCPSDLELFKIVLILQHLLFICLNSAFFFPAFVIYMS